MARSINDIQTQVNGVLTDTLAQAGVTIDTTTWSATNIMRLLVYVFAFCTNFLETLFDTFTSDVQTYVAAMKPGTAQWYANMALAFQFGFALLPDSDSFDNSGATDDEITASKIVNYAACVEQENDNGRMELRIKLATNSGGDLAPLTDQQLTSATEYLNRIKYAGVPLTVTSGAPDSLQLNLIIYYDPLVLSATGDRLDGTATQVVPAAVRNFLLALPFNGVFVTEYLQNAIAATAGVTIAQINSAASKYAEFDWAVIATMVTPDSGYLRIADADLQINYIAQSPIV
jgi:hypothetical protein